VIIFGLRRNLSEATREGLPQFGRASEDGTVTFGPPEGSFRQRPLSQRGRRLLGVMYLLLGLNQVVLAVRSSDEWLIHTATAALFVLGVVVVLLRKPTDPRAMS
jgi:hypothetical protein